MEPVRMVEAVLFSSGEPMRATEIGDATGLSPDAVRKAIKQLTDEYDERSSAIEICKTGLKYSMQLRRDATRFADQFGKMELSEHMLKTASIIAYNQPILQSDLAKKMGSDIYEDVRALRHHGMITGKRKGQTWLLTTTPKFSEYFGIGSTKKEDVKRWFESQSKK